MERSRDTRQETQQEEQPAKKRFAIHKLEERIAPKNCHYNPHGKMVGCGKQPDYGYYYDPCDFGYCW